MLEKHTEENTTVIMHGRIEKTNMGYINKSGIRFVLFNGRL